MGGQLIISHTGNILEFQVDGGLIERLLLRMPNPKPRASEKVR